MQPAGRHSPHAHDLRDAKVGLLACVDTAITDGDIARTAGNKRAALEEQQGTHVRAHASDGSTCSNPVPTKKPDC